MRHTGRRKSIRPHSVGSNDIMIHFEGVKRFSEQTIFVHTYHWKVGLLSILGGRIEIVQVKQASWIDNGKEGVMFSFPASEESSWSSSREVDIATNWFSFPLYTPFIYIASLPLDYVQWRKL